MSFVEKVIYLAATEVIDLYFILSDLVDVPISEDEQYETAYHDSMSLDDHHQQEGRGFIWLAKNLILIPAKIVKGIVIDLPLTIRHGVASQTTYQDERGLLHIPDHEIHKYQKYD